jgi:hypothetical protein
LARRLSEKNIKEIVKDFTLGKTLEELSEKFDCTKLTISRNIKKNIGENKYKEIVVTNKLSNQNNQNNQNIKNNSDEKLTQKKIKTDYQEDQNLPQTPFFEITPLDVDLDNSAQKDLTSVDINEIVFPDEVFMIVDKKIELEIKFLKDYPQWQFLSQEDLNRKTIEIFYELKVAKRFCDKEHKVIKVPNTEVFRIVAPILISKGISRIVTTDNLIAL